MGKSWEEALKKYLAEMNKTYVDGKIERLVPYFVEPAALKHESQRWITERKKLLEQGIKPMAAKTKVAPVHIVKRSEDEVEISLSLHHSLQYLSGEKSYWEEKQRLQAVRMRKEEDEWLFSGPWSWAIDQYKNRVAEDREKEEREPTGGSEAEAKSAQNDLGEKQETAVADKNLPSEAHDAETDNKQITIHIGTNAAERQIQHTEVHEATDASKAMDTSKATDASKAKDTSKATDASKITETHHADSSGEEILPLTAEEEAVLADRVTEAAYGGSYDREKAAAYAEQYWNSYNPAYIHFEVDCTNFVSQCLHAGGIPMISTGNRNSGWWYRGGAKPDWSYSWAVAHSLYLLLKSGKAPFHAEQVEEAYQLDIGDVICYDFDGDGRYQHNTIVVAKDANGMPLVDAHTYDSSMRYWEYTDSSAYTPNIKYAFFHIQA